MLCGEVSSTPIVDGNGIKQRMIHIDEDKRRFEGDQVFRVLVIHPHGEEEDAVHVRAEGMALDGGFQLIRVVDAVEDQFPIELAEPGLHSLQDFREKVCGEEGDEGEDGVGALSCECSCDGMRTVVESARDREHAFPCSFGNVRVVVEDARDRAYSDSCFAGNIVDGDRHRAVSTADREFWKRFHKFRVFCVSVKKKKRQATGGAQGWKGLSKGWMPGWQDVNH